MIMNSRLQKQYKKQSPIYNTKRPHLSIGLLTPETAHVKNERVKKLWKNYNQQNNQSSTCVYIE
jgi:transposase InsO family protein